MGVAKPLIGHWPARFSFVFYLCALVMAGSLLLGGGTRGGFLSDGLLQLLAIPLLLVALWNVFEAPLSRQAVWALLFCLAHRSAAGHSADPSAAGAMDCITEPGAIGGSHCARGTGAAVDADQRVAAGDLARAFSLIPAVAIFVATLLLSYRERRQLSPRRPRDRAAQRLCRPDPAGARPIKPAALFRDHQYDRGGRLLREQESFCCVAVFTDAVCGRLGGIRCHGGEGRTSKDL